jgi:hypothetical protein
MIQANLIPIPRRLARQRRSRVRKWVTVCTVYCVMLVAAYGALHAVWGHSGDVLEQDVVMVAGDITATEKEMKLVQPKLTDARLTLDASRGVGSQPDWSVLLALLAGEMREAEHGDALRLARQGMEGAALAVNAPAELHALVAPMLEVASRQIVLASCELEPLRDLAPAVNAASGPSAAPTQPSYTLVLTGMGLSQGAISRYVLRLEQTGLFDRVTLVESKRMPFGDSEAVSFRIGCTMGERK